LEFDVTVIPSVEVDVSTADLLFFLHFISISKYCTIAKKHTDYDHLHAQYFKKHLFCVKEHEDIAMAGSQDLN